MTKAIALHASLLAAAMGLALPSAPAAAETVEIGQPAEVELVEIEVEQHWTGRRPPSER